MRPVWTGSIGFGLVSIPVKLYLAANSDRVSFHMVHRKDRGAIQFRRFCGLEEREVPWDEIGRGFEYEKGELVLLDDKDLERISSARSRAIDIEQFVSRDQVGAYLYETPYYLEPIQGAERAYALLREALSRTGKVGIGRLALRDREHLAAVQPNRGALMLITIRWATEVREATGLNVPAEHFELAPKQLELAQSLVDQLSTPSFDLSAYKDDYQERVAEMIRQKIAGLPPPAERAAARRLPAQVVDLADVLRRSIEQTKRPGRPAAAQEEKGERRAPQQLAARHARQRRSK
jgi:DNA end-binding protein Ku